PDFVAKSFDSPVIATFAPAIRALRETNAKEKGIKLIVSGGFFSGENIFKAIALGADAICLDNAARIAIGCKLCGKCYEGRCEEGIATLDPLLEARLDWKKAGRKLANYIEIINKEIKVLTALAGKKSIKELDRSILRALNYDTAAITGIPLLGYEKELPMWLH
ncbi:MAG: glutamate synthase-related protein, partial [Candidatus Thermoplasmatota archaeon]